MLKVKVYYKDENDRTHEKVLNYLKPRRYMCGYSFEQFLKYVKEELYWEDINKEEVYQFEVENSKENWYVIIKKEQSNK